MPLTDGTTESALIVEPPPPWHGMAYGPVIIRSLLHDSESANVHRHETVELILNLGTSLGALAWLDAKGAEQTAEIASHHCCLIPSGVSHLASGLRVQGVVSLLLGGVLLAELATHRLSGVLVENVRRLTAQDSLGRGMVSELGLVIDGQLHPLMVNALALALALKLPKGILYLTNGYAKHVSQFSPSERKRIEEHILGHLADRVAVSEMARELSLSRAQFTRRFRATFGASPLQHALRMRVDRGVELLRSGEFRVAEAAHAVGFYDQSHFDRHCRKFYGCAPSVMQRI